MPGTELLLFNSNNYMEITTNRGNASQLLGLKLNSKIMIEFFKKFKESRQKRREMEKVKQQINVKLFAEKGYTFYTDIFSFAKAASKINKFDSLEDTTVLENIIKDAYNSNWELDEKIIGSKYFNNFTWREKYLVYLFKKRKIRVYDIENNTFKNDLLIYEYNDHPAPLVGDAGYIVQVNQEFIKKIVLRVY